jgi:hypothetical protein
VKTKGFSARVNSGTVQLNECRPEPTATGALPSGSDTSAVVFGGTVTSRANAVPSRVQETCAVPYGVSCVAPADVRPGPGRGAIRSLLYPGALLPEKQRRAATVFEQMVDPAMPEGRVHPGDERHLAGAFQDNRVIPFEGIRVADMPADAQRRALQIAESFLRLLPGGPRAARLREIEEHLAETWFSWIGGHEPGDVSYYRLQSPVLIAELDHHCGVFLDYDTPQPFHIHTVLRTPHGNDYGRAWVRQWQERNATA